MKRPSPALDLGLVGARASTGDRTAAGVNSRWPLLAGVAVVVAALALLGIARRVLLGLLAVVAGALLVFYMANAIDIETRGDSRLEQAGADALLSSSIGTPPLLAGGIAIIAGALALHD